MEENQREIPIEINENDDLQEVLIYCGNLTALDIALCRYRYFYSKKIIIKGDKFQVFVLKSEIATFQKLIKQIELLGQNQSQNRQLHYERYFKDLNYILNDTKSTDRSCYQCEQ